MVFSTIKGDRLSQIDGSGNIFIYRIVSRLRMTDEENMGCFKSKMMLGD